MSKETEHPTEPIGRRWDRNRACIAAATASNRFGQWVPQRWMELFMDAYEAMEPATPTETRKQGSS